MMAGGPAGRNGTGLKIGYEARMRRRSHIGAVPDAVEGFSVHILYPQEYRDIIEDLA